MGHGCNSSGHSSGPRIPGGHHLDLHRRRNPPRPRGRAPTNPSTGPREAEQPAPACMHSRCFLAHQPSGARPIRPAAHRRITRRGRHRSTTKKNAAGPRWPRREFSLGPISHSTRLNDPKVATLAGPLPNVVRNEPTAQFTIRSAPLFRVVDQQRDTGAHARLDQHMRHRWP